ncbi:ABC-ATPase domain-containing protein [Tenuibacillus multivorans]|uniref:Predicted ATPase of the ABC class n=1 Tax=Tenuibacillus multivorans TaxID=237069 RepID=A0A1H0EU71_9BACI|nr:ABC-ATPase domain-containing protein [Tenuibacillus multivorans]GEL76953.1 ATPase [Tenuibacillus multivorans]SDN85873.1 Predicted ATPase of the ABC class [Tenuibacillus multivorans]
MKKLQQQLQQIDRKGYKGYKSLQGKFTFPIFDLFMDYVQGDPFASPSKIRLVIYKRSQDIAPEWLTTKRRQTYIEDHIARSVHKAVLNEKTKIGGSGKSGLIAIDAPDQAILKRSAVSVTHEKVTICLSIGLPANGRRINGKEAEKLLMQALPSILKNSIFSLKVDQLKQVLHLADQHDAIRQKMNEENWIAFIANGSILPRQSGISTKPLSNAIPFQSPEENEVSFDIPHRDQPITGMAIKQGISLIVGGGFHGKSTLLEALEQGVYEHIAGDGREYVLTNPSAVKVRAEDGRSIAKVNISPFINDLPNGSDTNQFTTENASGSTSQAANVMEALEAGATTLLIDEDTSATNFMIRDERMQQLVKKEKEPITPFVQKVKQLRDEFDVSTVLVMGGSGDYFDIADQVIMMDQYVPINVTDRARQIAQGNPVEWPESSTSFGEWTNRTVIRQSIKQKLGQKAKVQAKGRHSIMIGRDTIDLSLVEQIVDTSQTRMIANMLKYMAMHAPFKYDLSITEWLNHFEKEIDENGLGFTQKNNEQHPGDLAKPRRYEVAAAINRLRQIKID